MNPPRVVIYHGNPIPLPQLAREKGIPITTLVSRIDRLGWTVDRAADTLSRKRPAGGRPARGNVRPVPKLRTKGGKAFARWREGSRERTKFFGAAGSPTATTAYQRWAARWLESHGRPDAPAAGSTVADLVTRFARWAASPDGLRVNGRPSSERYVYRAACRRLVELYGGRPAAAFAPSDLRALRASWVAEHHARSTCNSYTSRIVRVFAWGVSRELIPAATVAALREVERLQRGRSAAAEPEPVATVPDWVVRLTIPHLHRDPGRCRMLADMIGLQLASGIRPGELCAMVGGCVDRSAAPWVWDLKEHHKTAHRGKPRKVYFGPRAREILGPRLDAAPAGQPLWRIRSRGRGKLTPLTRLEYQRMIGRAVETANAAHRESTAAFGPNLPELPEWAPNQLRHNRATELHRIYEDDEAVAAALGNSPEVARRVYVDSPGERAARRIAEATG